MCCGGKKPSWHAFRCSVNTVTGMVGQTDTVKIVINGMLLGRTVSEMHQGTVYYQRTCNKAKSFVENWKKSTVQEDTLSTIHSDQTLVILL